MSNVLKGAGLKGGEISIEGDLVKISPGLGKKTRFINVGDIAGVEVRKGVLGLASFIKLHFNDDFHLERTNSFHVGTDENAVVFNTNQQNLHLAEKIKYQIESHQSFRVNIKEVVKELKHDFILHSHVGKTLLVKGNSVIIIKHQGIISERREKTLPISNISSVEVKKPGVLAGYIQFSIAGGQVLNSSYTLTGGGWSAATDENSVMW